MTAKPKASRNVNDAGIDVAGVIEPSRALVPHVVRVNERRVARGFWPKIRKVAGRIPFASDALAVWWCAKDPQTPAAAKAMIAAALAYFVLPADAIPDVVAGLGFTDDAAVMAALLAVVGKHLKPRHKDAARAFLDRLGEGG